ncbi:MAG: CRISPR-associated endonuclease Cas3'' [Nitrososphaeria archaeon]
MPAGCNSPLLAKSNGEPLSDHLINTAEIAKIIYEKLPVNAKKYVRLEDLIIASIFHDLGKATATFQKALISKTGPGYRHEILSAAIARAYGYPDSVIFAILTHHKSTDKIEEYKQEIN